MGLLSFLWQAIIARYVRQFDTLAAHRKVGRPANGKMDKNISDQSNMSLCNYSLRPQVRWGERAKVDQRARRFIFVRAQRKRGKRKIQRMKLSHYTQENIIEIIQFESFDFNKM